MYINCHSCFSYKYGVLSLKDMLSQAQARGLGSLALTDINSTSGVLDFVRMAPDYGIEPVVGIDFRNGADQLYIGIARNNEGYQELAGYLSRFLQSGQKFPARAPSLPMLGSFTLLIGALSI